jgi:citrate synthase
VWGRVLHDRITNNTISATAFKAIAASPGAGEPAEHETSKGLRVADRGFLNTAVIQSTITYIDGDAGVLRYRGYPIEQLARRSSHLETAYLLVYGVLPSRAQLASFEGEVMSHSPVHADAENFFRSFRCVRACRILSFMGTRGGRNPFFFFFVSFSFFWLLILGLGPVCCWAALFAWFGRYDAHPMAILTSAFAYLGSYYGEANPSLQGTYLLPFVPFATEPPTVNSGPPRQARNFSRKATGPHSQTWTGRSLG